jgi:hypothetical protein
LESVLGAEGREFESLRPDHLILNKIELFATSEKFAGDDFEGGPFPAAHHAVDSKYLPPRCASSGHDATFRTAMTAG